MAVISLAEGTPGEKPPADRETREMRSELIELRAKVQSLEEQMKKMESTVEQMNQPRLNPLNLPPANSSLFGLPTTDLQPPKIWGEGKVNGWTYYIVPCEEKGR